MIITKSELLNDVINANTELHNEYHRSSKSLYFDILILAGATQIKSGNKYDVISDKDFKDNHDELLFVKRGSVLCDALEDFYAPNGTIDQFDKVANNNITGFYSQMLADNHAGFWFIARDMMHASISYYQQSDSEHIMDSLVPYNKQKLFMEIVNSGNSTKDGVSKQVKRSREWLNTNLKATQKTKLTKSQLLTKMINQAHEDIGGSDYVEMLYNILHTSAKYFVNDEVGDYVKNDGWLPLKDFKKRHYGVNNTGKITLNGKVLVGV